MPEFKLPDVGEGLTEAEIVTWKVKVGDVVKVNDIVVEIETAKSLVELPSPYAGTVQALHVPEGETVAVGTPIITVGEAAEAPAARSGARRSTCPTRRRPAAGRTRRWSATGPRAASSQRRPRRGGATPATDAGAAAQLQLQGAFGQGAAEPADAAGAGGRAGRARRPRAVPPAAGRPTSGCWPSRRCASWPRTSASTCAR